MNRFSRIITRISNNALAIVGIVLVLAGLFDALVFCKSISEHRNILSNEPNRLIQGFNYQNRQDFSSGYQQQFLASNTVPQAPWYIVPEPEPTGLRLKTIVTR